MTAGSAIEIIEDEFFRKGWYKLPNYYSVSRGEFEQASYQIWAIKEIKRAIRLYSDRSPIDVVEVFTKQMNSYSCSGKDGSIIFSIAKDVGEHALDVLIRYSREEQRWVI